MRSCGCRRTAADDSTDPPAPSLVPEPIAVVAVVAVGGTGMRSEVAGTREVPGEQELARAALVPERVLELLREVRPELLVVVLGQEQAPDRRALPPAEPLELLPEGPQRHLMERRISGHLRCSWKPPRRSGGPWEMVLV